ncbi:MAG: DUF4153 domain-containing protein [Janthinobacterium lividum]
MLSNTLQNNLSLMLNQALLVIKRFPLPLLCALAFFIISKNQLAVFIVNKNQLETLIIFFQGLGILFCGCCWFIFFKLYTESHKWSSVRYYLIGLPVFLIIAYAIHKNLFTLCTFNLLGLGLFLSIFIAPFVGRQTNDGDVWQFNYDLWRHIGLTALVAIMLSAGIFAILASLKFLLGFNFKDQLYVDTWLFITTFFCPVMVMFKIPTSFKTTESPHLGKVMRSLLLYVILPILLIYDIILHAYAAKIALEWNLPKGGIAYLVSIFNTIAVLTYFASYPLHKTSAIFAFFSKHLFKFMLVPLILLTIGVGNRIDQFGITEGRYAILLHLIWMTLIIVFSYVKQRDQLFKFSLSSIVVLFIFASFGPWSITNVSNWSQTQRLEKVLEKHQILINAKIRKASHPLTFSEELNIHSMVDYLVQNKKFDILKQWFDDPGSPKFSKDFESLTSTEIREAMGIELKIENKKKSIK